MANSPFFTVVIPTYNHAAYIGPCLESLRRQSFGDWHAVVVNNYSQDNTEAIVLGFRDPRIHLINFDNRGVIAASRNEGIRHARGRYIAFLDSDDEFLPGKLRAVFEATRQHASAALLSHLLWERDVITGKLRVLDPHRSYSFSYRNLLLYGNHLLNSATVVARSFIESNSIRLNENPAFVSCEDYDLWLQCASHGARHVLIDQVLGVYNILPGSASGNFPKHHARVGQLLRWHCYEVQSFSAWPGWLWYRAVASTELAKAARYWHAGQRLKAGLHFAGAFARNPACCIGHINHMVLRFFRRKRWQAPAALCR